MEGKETIRQFFVFIFPSLKCFYPSLHNTIKEVNSLQELCNFAKRVFIIIFGIDTWQISGLGTC